MTWGLLCMSSLDQRDLGHPLPKPNLLRWEDVRCLEWQMVSSFFIFFGVFWMGSVAAFQGSNLATEPSRLLLPCAGSSCVSFDYWCQCRELKLSSELQIGVFIDEWGAQCAENLFLFQEWIYFCLHSEKKQSFTVVRSFKKDTILDFIFWLSYDRQSCKLSELI